jgi:hypothetical protein
MDWFLYNWVKLNPPKSKVLYFTPSELANKLIMLPLRVGVNLIEPSTSTRALQRGFRLGGLFTTGLKNPFDV